MNKKGWSIIELLTAVGIVTVLASIAIVSYLKYYQHGQFTKIHQTAKTFSSAVEVCLLQYDHDPTRCASFDRLKFTCDHCESTVWFKPGNPSTPGDLGNFLINMTVNEFRAATTYRSAATPTTPVRIQRTGTQQKFCAAHPNLGTYISLPTRKCDADSDCKTGESCYYFPLPQWGGPSPWQVIP